MEVLTAAQSLAQQRHVAGALRARGLSPGDRVAVVLPSSARLLSLVLGALRCGVVPVMIDPGLLAHERATLLDDADAGLVLDRDAHLRALTDDDRHVADLADVPLARPMHYTSGTTGRPKGVWSGVLPDSDARALVAEEGELWGFDATDRHLVCGPLHHSAPLRFATSTLLAGGAVVVGPRFDASTVARAIAEHRPTTTFVAPTHLQRLMSLPTPPAGGSFRLVAHAGAPCPVRLKQRVLAHFGDDTVWEFYGSTEGQVTACPGREWRERPGTVGRARPGRVVTVEDDGTVWCAVPAYARFTYWQDEERTARAWRTDEAGAAFTVGDLGRLTPDGYLHLDGRRDDLVISGGVNVYPAEVEQALTRCPGVDEAAVFGVDDERWGHRVCAAVVGTADAQAVLDFARRTLVGYKRPKEVHVVDDLPRTPSGKVQRLALPAMLGLDR